MACHLAKPISLHPSWGSKLEWSQQDKLFPVQQTNQRSTVWCLIIWLSIHWYAVIRYWKIYTQQPMQSATQFSLSLVKVRTVFKWLSKNQNQSNYLRPITTGTNIVMNQSQFLAITCNSLEAWEKSRLHGAMGFGFASHWLKNWCDSFKLITKRSNCNHIITFDSRLKTALS